MEDSKNNALSVSVYISQINSSLKSHSGRVRGEVTSIKQSGKAIYFKVKDTQVDAILDCMIWLNVYQMNSIDLKTGDQIIITGTPEIFAPYGIFRFMVSTVEYEGEGRLKKDYEKLKAQLMAEGLVEAERKRILPSLPKKIGVITPKSGVVFDDFTNNLNKYGFNITKLYSQVDGKRAIHDILNSISTMSKQDIEVLVIIRGGGAWESLQPFNTESVVRAIAGFKCPVITGIGHDVDVTLSELVADYGLSTPTAVAQALNRPWDRVINFIDSSQLKIMRYYSDTLNENRRLLDRSSDLITRSFMRSLNTLSTRIIRSSSSIKSFYYSLEKQISSINSGLKTASGILRNSLKNKHLTINRFQDTILHEARSLIAASENSINNSSELILAKLSEGIRLAERDIDFIEKTVTANDPRRLMKTGYSLSFINGKLARNLKDVAKGDKVTTQLADGQFTSEVKEVE